MEDDLSVMFAEARFRQIRLLQFELRILIEEMCYERRLVADTAVGRRRGPDFVPVSCAVSAATEVLWFRC
jgi:hypothetical protein